MRRLLLVCTYVTVVCFLTACGQKSQSTETTAAADTSSATSSHDPCRLLTIAEVAAAVHKPAVAAESTDSTHCTYSPKGGGMNTIVVEANWSDADAKFQGGQGANAIMGDAGKAPKVGDASYSTAMGNVFYARKGSGYVGIDMRAAAVNVKLVGPQLAAKALSRM